MSKTKTIAEAITTRITGLDGITWDTDPIPVWYPDLSREALKDMGLTALVVVPKVAIDRLSRGKRAGEVEAHVCVIKSMANDGSDEWADGELVVNAAELIAFDLLTAGIADLAAGSKADQEPVISADYARQYRLWVSYLKFELFLRGS